MAGGSDWFLEGKTDAVHSFTTGTEADGDLRHWRREETEFIITRQEAAALVDTGRGHIGKTAGVLMFMVGPSRLSSRSLSEGSRFVCTGDELRPGEKPAGFFEHAQKWTWVGPDMEYDPDTGDDL